MSGVEDLSLIDSSHVSSLDCWAVFRERAHSPGRESDDERILRATAGLLSAAGFAVTLKRPDEAAASLEPAPPRMLLMCERREILARLAGGDGDGGTIINRPRAILNTYRTAMHGLLERAGIPQPPGIVISTESGEPARRGPVWVKRGDVHNTRPGDVVFAATRSAAVAALRGLAERGIGQAIVQPHVPGDLIKFYGIGDPLRGASRPHWFKWFYHRDQVLGHHGFDPGHLESIAGRAAAMLGLEVYGGDFIVTANGEALLIDVNAWPSFALYREQAARRIASYAARRFAGSASDRGNVPSSGHASSPRATGTAHV